MVTVKLWPLVGPKILGSCPPPSGYFEPGSGATLRCCDVSATGAEGETMAPLEGLKVVEAASFLSGPMAGMMLADLGATVIKVEPPRGDPYRRFGRAYGDSSLVFKAANQNKQSVSLDLKSEEGMHALLELLADADVFITNWRPSVAPGLGLAPERIREQFPRLIWVRVSGYGQDGPRAELPAYDGIIQARSGSSLSGTSEPMNTNNNIADKVSAMFAAQTITAALHQRERTGLGSVCDLAMVDALAYFYGADISAGHRVVGADPDLSVGQSVINDATFPTAEGYLTLAPVTGRQLRRALEAAGCGEAFGDVMNADRADTFRVFASAIGPKLLQRSAEQWEATFADADVPAAVVSDFGDHIADEQTVHNRMYRAVPDESVGEWLLVRYPGLFDGEPATAAGRPAPRLAEPDG